MILLRKPCTDAMALSLKKNYWHTQPYRFSSEREHLNANLHEVGERKRAFTSWAVEKILGSISCLINGSTKQKQKNALFNG
jgi:hypothetical protein